MNNQIDKEAQKKKKVEKLQKINLKVSKYASKVAKNSRSHWKKSNKMHENSDWQFNKLRNKIEGQQE